MGMLPNQLKTPKFKVMTKVNPSTLGSTLKSLREERQISMTDMAKLSGLTRLSIHRIETGVFIPNTEALVNILKVLNLELQINIKQKK